MQLRGKRVFVGLSGGVDSGVTAAKLQDAGAKVTGVFIKGWYPPGMPCTWAEDRRDAMRVAARLNIPFHTLDASTEYKQGVIDYLLAEYKAGRTPNPDVMCNREVKFGAFWRFANEQGADYIATGHYAQVNDGMLYRGVDEGKDQSYFLWAVPADALAMTLMPLGNTHKDETRTLARRYRLPNATKKDSQGICFLGSISVADFLRNEFGSEPGVARDITGKEVGGHDGVLLHTLGERIALTNAAPGPWYVLQKDIEKNELLVSHERLEHVPNECIRLVQENWFVVPDENDVLTAQYRYHGPRVAGTWRNDAFHPQEPLGEPVAAGQSLVLYRDTQVVGGGIIA